MSKAPTREAAATIVPAKTWEAAPESSSWALSVEEDEVEPESAEDDGEDEEEDEDEVEDDEEDEELDLSSLLSSSSLASP